MKPILKIISIVIPLIALSLLLSGCYTQLATTADDGEGSYRTPSRGAQTYDQSDTTSSAQQTYYDDYDQMYGHSRVGFGYYYPSSWYWDYGFGDPYFYGYPFYGGMYFYPSAYGYYGYGYPNYWGYGFGYGYGSYPYGYYNGYPFVVYAGGGSSSSQTRNSGYRRTGFSRAGGYVGSTGSSVRSLPGASGVNRGTSGQGTGSVSPASRRSSNTGVRGTNRNTAPPSSTRSRVVSSPGRSGSSGVRSSAPSSGGSRSPSGSNRNSGSSRGRGSSGAPGASYYRSSPSYSPSSAPSYTPRSAPSSSPSSAPVSSPSSSGSSGGQNRSSGATRSGRN